MGRAALLVVLAVLAIPAGLAAASVILASDRVDHPVVTAFVTLLAAWAFVCGGLVAWARQPANRTGALMVCTGFLLLAGSLSGTDHPVPFTIGVLTGPISNAVFAHLLLAFPHGRLHSRAERTLVALAYLDVTAVQVAMLLVMDYTAGRGCPCPTNLLFVWDNSAVHDGVMTAQRVFGAALIAGVVIVIARRWRAASAPLRRSLGPVLVTGAVTALATGASLLAYQVSDSPAGTYLGLTASAALAFVPLGFLAGLVRSRLARAAVGDLIVELGHTAAPGQLRDALARAVGDPSLDVAYWLPERERYADLRGHSVELPAAGGPRAVTLVNRHGRRIAAVIHDPSLNDDPSLVDAACAAAGLALENERLQADLRSRLEELRASRARIVHAGDTERRRLERNLHDGAQQRLVSLSVALALAEAKLRTDPAAAQAMLATARRDVQQALDELRELARGIHPAILTERGLGIALEALATRAPLPVELAVATGRLPEPVEAATYYVVSEALANAAKHAQAQCVRVTVAREDGRAVVVVSDDGAGGANLAAGSGLRGLADRVAGARRPAVGHEPGRRRHDGTGGHPMRVVVAEDSVLLREGLAHILREAGFDVIGQVGTAEHLLGYVRSYRPDVAIVDIRMPPTYTDEGLRAAQEIRIKHPGVGVLVLSQYVEPGYAMELLAESAEGVGYLLKERVSDIGEFAAAVQRVAAGGSALDPAIVSQIVGRRRRHDPIAELTPREREVLELMAEGRSNQGIAERLVVTERAVEKHVTSIFQKLRLPAAAEDHRRVLAVLAFLRS